MPKPAGRSAPQIGELNASADGRSVKDMVCTSIGRACQEAHGFDEFRSLLSGLGVDVSVRGRHLTYTVAASGRRFRDVRLGVGYGEQEVMGRIGRGTMNVFAFDRTLVASRDATGMRVWRKALNFAGMENEGITIHSLRHSYASIAIANGADVKTLQKQLGHASATITLDTYAGLWPERLNEDTDAVNDARDKAIVFNRA